MSTKAHLKNGLLRHGLLILFLIGIAWTKLAIGREGVACTPTAIHQAFEDELIIAEARKAGYQRHDIALTRWSLRKNPDRAYRMSLINDLAKSAKTDPEAKKLLLEAWEKMPGSSGYDEVLHKRILEALEDEAMTDPGLASNLFDALNEKISKSPEDVQALDRLRKVNSRNLERSTVAIDRTTATHHEVMVYGKGEGGTVLKQIDSDATKLVERGIPTYQSRLRPGQGYEKFQESIRDMDQTMNQWERQYQQLWEKNAFKATHVDPETQRAMDNIKQVVRKMEAVLESAIQDRIGKYGPETGKLKELLDKVKAVRSLETKPRYH